MKFTVTTVVSNQNFLNNVLENLERSDVMSREDVEVYLVLNGIPKTKKVEKLRKKKKGKFEIIENSTMQSLWKNLKMVAKLGKGKYILEIDQDVEFPPDIMKRFDASLNLVKEKGIPENRIGYIFSSAVGYVGLPYQSSLNLESYELFPVEKLNEQASRDEVFEVAAGAEFCCIFPREMAISYQPYGEGQAINDFHFSAYLRKKGKLNFITRKIVVKHYSKSLNTDKAIEWQKDNVNPNIRLAALFYAPQEFEDGLLFSLERLPEFFDEIIVLSERKVEHPRITENIVQKGDFREILAKAAFEKGCDWACFIHPYEEITMTKEQKTRLGYISLTQDIGLISHVLGLGDFIEFPKEPRILPRFFRVSENPYFNNDTVVTPAVVLGGQTLLNCMIINHGLLKGKTSIYEKLKFDVEEVSKMSRTVSKLNENYGVSLITMCNDFQELAQFFSSLSFIPDEIVLADTTEDGSLEVFKEAYGLKYVHHPWEDDYSAPRNSALKLVTQPWTMYLDSDEMIHNPQHLPKMVRHSYPDGYLFSFINRRGDGKTIMSSTIRLWRTHPDIKFTGKVHETIDEAIDKLKYVVIDSPIKAENKGLMNPEELERKIKYYEELLEKALKEDPENPRVYFNLALAKLEKKDYVGSLDMFHKCLKYTEDPNMIYLFHLSTSLIEVAKAILQDAEKKTPEGHYIAILIKQLKQILSQTENMKLELKGDQWQ